MIVSELVVFNKVTRIHDDCYNDGIIDSLRSMIFSENFITTLV